MSYFKMLGYRFVSIGPWLYNIDSKTWSTYSFDGWKKPRESFSTDDTFIWSNETEKRTVATAYDDLICTYSTICTPLSYREMQDEEIFNDEEPSLIEGKHQWGEFSFFTTRMLQDEQKISVDGVMVYIREGLLKRGAKMEFQPLTSLSMPQSLVKINLTTLDILNGKGCILSAIASVCSSLLKKNGEW
jgi:hypothetical protein